jgi:hypothetical protein
MSEDPSISRTENQSVSCGRRSRCPRLSEMPFGERGVERNELPLVVLNLRKSTKSAPSAILSAGEARILSIRSWMYLGDGIGILCNRRRWPARRCLERKRFTEVGAGPRALSEGNDWF